MRWLKNKDGERILNIKMGNIKGLAFSWDRKTIIVDDRI